MPWLHIWQHLPQSRTVDRLSSPQAMFQTINSGLGFSHAQESSCGIHGSHPQPAEGRGPIHWRGVGEEGCYSPPARWAPEGCMILQTGLVRSVGLPAS